MQGIQLFERITLVQLLSSLLGTLGLLGGFGMIVKNVSNSHVLKCCPAAEWANRRCASTLV